MNMQKDKVYIYGKHAIEEAQAHAPHVIKKIFTKVKGEGHGGYVAIINTEKLLVPFEAFIKDVVDTPSTSVVVLAGLHDPHNVGAIIRSAAAFGFSAVIMPTSNQAPITGTVVKTSVGMVFRIPLVVTDSIATALKELKVRGFTVYGLAGRGSADLNSEKFKTPTVFVVGNEGSGMTGEIESACDVLLSIPIHPRTESLNAAAAAAVVMHTWSTHHAEALK